MTGYRFIGTPLPLTEREVYHLGKYLKKARQAGGIVAFEQFDLDLTALLTPVQLDCQNCHLAHHESCCEGGFPFPPESGLLSVIDEHSERMLSRHFTAEAAAQIREAGLFEAFLETDGHPTVTTLDGNCAFCRIEGKGPACMVHRYALEVGIVPEDFKPLSCLLYPLDLIEHEATGRVLITALTANTARFSRWGEDYFHDFLCANAKTRADVAAAETDLRDNIRRGIASDVFALENYQPAYQAGKGTLTTLYGEALWQAIDEQVQKTQQGKGS